MPFAWLDFYQLVATKNPPHKTPPTPIPSPPMPKPSKWQSIAACRLLLILTAKATPIGFDVELITHIAQKKWLCGQI
ncbi:hypothetical protein [Moraxella lacunata]|uniref:hypothetical protein n=1 Tax=Moraxella lacunata TaxID=477 RepID=UPI003EE36276